MPERHLESNHVLDLGSTIVEPLGHALASMRLISDEILPALRRLPAKSV